MPLRKNHPDIWAKLDQRMAPQPWQTELVSVCETLVHFLYSTKLRDSSKQMRTTCPSWMRPGSRMWLALGFSSWLFSIKMIIQRVKGIPQLPQPYLSSLAPFLELGPDSDQTELISSPHREACAAWRRKRCPTRLERSLCKSKQIHLGLSSHVIIFFYN